MESLKKVRRVVRTGFTRYPNQLEALLQGAVIERDAVLLTLQSVEQKSEELLNCDSRIMDLLTERECTNEEVDQEWDQAEEYRLRLLSIKQKAERYLHPPRQREGEEENSLGGSQNGQNNKRKFKLPKIEVEKFTGDIKSWLQFWSQFKKIDSDPDIVDDDKMQYLLQSTVEGSRARELVKSYPLSGENYSRVIESFKGRFGREEMLVEVYVRDLLQLVLANTLHTTKKITLTKLFDQLDSYLRALDTLGVTTDKCAAILYPLVESCLPEELLRAWQRAPPTLTIDGVEKSRLDQLMDFLRKEVEREEKIAMAMNGFGAASEKMQVRKQKNIEEIIPTAAGLFVAGGNNKSKVKCLFCEKPHETTKCVQSNKMSLLEKRKLLISKGTCYFCLTKRQAKHVCPAWVQCALCGKKHLITMCPDLPVHKEKTAKSPVKIMEAMEKNNVLSSLSPTFEVFLQTLVVMVNGKGCRRPVRVIVDTGSQRSYILQKLAAEMNYVCIRREKMVHQLFGGEESSQQNHNCYEVNLSKLTGQYNCTFTVLDQPIICGSIPRIQKGSSLLSALEKKEISLSDETSANSEIEILIGADVAGKLFTGRRLQLQSGLVAMETLLGWTLMGRVKLDQAKASVALMVTSQAINTVDISDLWKLDLIGIRDPVESQSKKELEELTQQHFLQTLTINSMGRYEIHLPWVDGHPKLPTNYEIAKKRLRTTTNKLIRDGHLEDYQKVFEEWMEEQIIELVSDSQLEVQGHYLPHRAVVKENSGTTRIRPVFDASARTKTHPSLNDCLAKGPNLNELIPSVLLGFREKQIGVISDIRKAFLQVSVRKFDCDSLRFLWWDKSHSKEIVYRHKRVVFGVSSSPFLLCAVINFHLENSPVELQPLAQQLRKSFYMDNCVTSVRNKVELEQFMFHAQQLMLNGKFELRGWEFNHDTSEDKETPVLGLVWNKNTDTLQCNQINLEDVNLDKVTKRTILSVIQRIFDPIGFTCPVTLCPKMLLQQTWEIKSGWDVEVPENIKISFLKWVEELNSLSQIKIPRWLLSADCQSMTLHTFCDASSKAYAAVVFLREVTRDRVNVKLIMAKSRVAPLKKVTIARLELLAALIGTRMIQFVKANFSGGLNIPVVMWSDSTTVLSWITKTEEVWATFVGNRVKDIQAMTVPVDWRYVGSELHPADLPSRGCSVNKLINSNWWKGPESEWPCCPLVYDNLEINKEKRKTISSLISTVKRSLWYCKRLSKYFKILRTIGWQCRFVYNCRAVKEKRLTGELTVQELSEAELKLLKLVQNESFRSKDEKPLSTLFAFADENGLFRIETKIIKRKDTRNFRYPIILPASHPIVTLLIQSKHEKLCHAGLQVTLNSLREDYWILGGRRSIRSVLTKCVKCRRQVAKRIETLPASLPLNRVKDASIFEIIGVDLAGPVVLKGGEKAWLVLFTCAIYRAIHLELVTSLSTDSFFQSLRRFIARRGRPATIYSDNETNFMGADNAINTIDWSVVQSYSAIEKIHWIFNPPSAAWWGGWWERLIQMVKQLLRRVLGKASLKYEEFSTILCYCESIINSRPLTYISGEAEDLVPLTPAMFLQERLEFGVPELDILDECSINKRLRYLNNLRSELRRRFRAEYLSQLVHRYHHTVQRKLTVGDIVIIATANVKRLNWPLAKVEEICISKDGQIRTVKVKTAKGILVRPVQKLHPLELSQEAEQQLVEQHENVKSQLKGSTPIYHTRSGRAVRIPERFM